MKKLTFAFKALTITIDAVGIIISLFSQDTFDNTKLKYIVHFCKAFRTELLLLLVLLFALFYFLPFVFRHFKASDWFNRMLCVSAIVASAVICYPTATRLVKARYYYFNNNIWESHAQFAALESGVEYLKQGEYELALNEFELVEKFSSTSKFTHIVNAFKDDIKANTEASDYLYHNYVTDNPDFEEKVQVMKVCAELNPNKYQHIHKSLMEKVQTAIDAYPSLYAALVSNDYRQCRELMKEHGDIWFEPIVKDKLLHDNRQYIMRLLHEYLDGEECIQAQRRLYDKYSK